jgi:hypothetical protein
LTDVAPEQLAPENNTGHIDRERIELCCSRSGKPHGTRRLAAARQRHRNALDLNRRLGTVTNGDRKLERPLVTGQGSGAIATDQRAIGKKVVGEMLGPQISRPPRDHQRFARQGFDRLELSNAH